MTTCRTSLSITASVRSRIVDGRFQFLHHPNESTDSQLQDVRQDKTSKMYGFFEEAFDDLTGLALEFTSTDRSSLPFSHMGDYEVRKIMGVPPYSDVGEHYFPLLKGNYVAGSIRRNLREESRRQTSLSFRNLSLVFDLPLEVTLEVFEHLHPVDLYSLIRSTKGLRNLLLSRKSLSVWQNSFLRHPEIPACPEDISFPRWAFLLFGPSTCEVCDRQEAITDFTFLTRLCQYCWVEQSGSRSDFSHFVENPEQRSILWTLVKANYQTNPLMYTSYFDHVDPTFRRADVDKMAKQMQGFLTAIEQKIPNAEEDYAEFKKSHAASVQKAMKHIVICSKWASGIFRHTLGQAEEARPLLVKRWKKLLRSSGYHAEDVDGIGAHIDDILYSCGATRFAKKVFRRSLPELGPYLREQKAGRLRREHEVLVRKREDEARAFYKSYQQTLDPVTWDHLPHSARILNLKSISRYTHFGEPDGFFPSEAAQRETQLFVEKWLASGRQHFFQRLPEDYSADAGQDPLELAIFSNWSLFPSGCPVSTFIGWQDLALHLNCFIPADFDVASEVSTFTSELSFSQVGHDVLEYLLHILGREIGGVLATELIAMKERFVCTSCSLATSHGTKGRYTMTIAECVSHAVGSWVNHSPESFSLLTEEALESVLFHEDAYSFANTRNWSCRHCSTHLEEGASRKFVIAHAKEEHSITHPTEVTDYFYRRVAHKKPRRRYLLALDQPANYRCKRCIDAKKARLWRHDQMMSHLKDKHGVKRPTQGIDWYQIQFYAQASSDTAA